MDPPPISPIINLDNQSQGFVDFDDIAPIQPPSNDTPSNSTLKAKKIKKWAKHANTDEEIMQDVKFESARIANTLEADKN